MQCNQPIALSSRQPGLAPLCMARYEQAIRDLASSLLDDVLHAADQASMGSFLSHPTVDVDWMGAFAKSFPMMVALDLVGFDRSRHRWVKERADHSVALMSGASSGRANVWASDELSCSTAGYELRGDSMMRLPVLAGRFTRSRRFRDCLRCELHA